METGWIVSIVLGSALVILLVFLIVWAVFYKNKNTESEKVPTYEPADRDENTVDSFKNKQLLKSFEDHINTYKYEKE